MVLHDFLNKLSEQERKVLTVAVVFILGAFMDRLFFGPIMDRLKSIDEEIQRQENSVKRDLRFLSYKDKIIKENEVFDKYFKDKIPDDDIINADFLSVIERLATQSNVNLVKSNPAQSKKKKDSLEYYANLDCTGQLKDVISFMHLVNSSEELLKIVRFAMTPKKGAENEINASMTVVKLIISP